MYSTRYIEQANAGSPGTAEATDRVTDCGWVFGGVHTIHGRGGTYMLFVFTV